MATADDIDPAQAGRRANEQLSVAVSRLDEHIQALTAPTMELALAQRKRITETGLEELDQSALVRKFVSQAGPGAAIGTSEPGQLNPDASFATRGSSPVGTGTGPQWNEMFGATGGQAGAPSQWAREQSAIAGKTNVEAQRLEEEPIRIPSFGDWRLDAVLKLASQVSGKKALSNYETYASEAGSEAMPAQEWLEKQSPMAAGNVSGTLAKASQAAVVGSIAKTYLSPLVDIGFGASNAGASLGYSPQGEGLGGGVLGASHYFGIPNPIAAFTSPAGRQGLGKVVNAAEAATGGTGIGIGEANTLRQALASQGWSNQRSGGAFGFAEGGEQESLALAMEPLVKKGFNSTTSIEQLGEATNALKLGQATPEELKKVLEQLPEAAKILHKTLEEVTAGMEEFAAKSVEGGSSIIHGMQTYGEVAKITGMNPTIIQGINQSSFGQVQAISEGVKPWDIEGMTGPMKSLSALKTIEKLEGYTPTQHGTKKTNAKGEVEEVTPEQEKYAYIHMLDPSITEEQAKRLHEIGPKLKAVAEGTHQAKRIGENVVGYQEGNQEHKRESQIAYHEEVTHRHEETYIQQLKKEISETPSGGFFGGEKKGELEEKLRKTEESAKNRSNKISSALASAKKDTGLTATEQKLIGRELQGPKGLYKTAEEAGVGAPELANIKKDKLAQQPGEIAKALEKINAVNIEKENEGNAKVELTGEAKKWFRLKFPNAKSPKEESNAGGKSTSSGATNVTGAGESAGSAAAAKAQEGLSRFEATHGTS
jgi:hypothetical protein